MSYVENRHRNLLAISALDQKGIYCTFGGGKVEITKNGKLYAAGEYFNRLYAIKFIVDWENHEENEESYKCELNITYLSCINLRL